MCIYIYIYIYIHIYIYTNMYIYIHMYILRICTKIEKETDPVSCLSLDLFASEIS